MIIKIKNFILLLILFININISQASIYSQIQYLIKKYNLSNAKIAIATQRTITGNELYLYKANKRMKPASNNKIFTIVAALLTISNNFRFTTSVMYNANNVKHHILYDDLYIKFTGNPALTSDQLSILINKIKTKKCIYKITGNVYLVGIFSKQCIPDGWSKSDSKFCYGALASSFTFNRNCTIIKLIKNNNKKTRIIKLSNTKNINIKNTVKYNNTINKINILMNNKNILYISGYLSKITEKIFKLSIKNQDLEIINTINYLLNNNNIKHNNIIITNNVPYKCTKQIQISSTTIKYFINQTLKYSDNLYAETILNIIGLKKNGIGSTKYGTKAVQNILCSKLGLDTSSLIMHDGSGLSHLDRVTPKFMVNFLTKTYNSRIGQEFYNYLPSSGISGTISYRMGGVLLGKVHAKTGTLYGVSTLSGYILTAKKHIISFSIMINNLKSSNRYNARRFQDKVVYIFYRKL